MIGDEVGIHLGVVAHRGAMTIEPALAHANAIRVRRQHAAILEHQEDRFVGEQQQLRMALVALGSRVEHEIIAVTDPVSSNKRARNDLPSVSPALALPLCPVDHKPSS